MDGKDLDLDIKVEDIDIDDGSGGDTGEESGGKVEKEDIDSDESIEALRKGIEESFDDRETKPPTGGKKEKETATLELDEQEFFSGSQDDLDNVTSDPKAFNAMLNNIYKKAVEKGHSLAVENIMRSAPDIIKSQIVQQMTITRAVTKFYDDNKDLAPYKKTVASIANAVAAKYPDQPLPKILAATEKIARQRLQLKKQVEEKERGSNTDARFPKKPKGGRGSDRSTDGLNGLEKELDEMSKAIGG